MIDTQTQRREIRQNKTSEIQILQLHKTTWEKTKLKMILHVKEKLEGGKTIPSF